jgi:hypothetical protein
MHARCNECHHWLQGTEERGTKWFRRAGERGPNGSGNYKQHTRDIKKIIIFRTTKCTSRGGTSNFEKGDKSDPWERE